MEQKEYQDRAGKIFGLREGEVIAIQVVSFHDTGNVDILMRIKRDSLKTKKLKALVKETLNNNL